MPVRALALFSLGLTAALAAVSQQPAQQPEPQPGYTLHTDVRIVLADVTVTDGKGNVVHDLPASAFHVTVDKKPLPLASFEEHAIAPTAMVATPAAGDETFSNEYLLHLPPVLNIVVLDTSTLTINEQMYLAVEFNHFVQQLPVSQPIAIYARTSEHLVLIQNFTSDHTLLTAAAAKVMPQIPTPHESASDVSLLAELAQHLAPIPGRKSVLWFSGGSGVLQIGDPEVTEDEEALRQIYDQLEAARVAVYPIDARGLTTTVGDPVMTAQHQQMSAGAEATGGAAFFDLNSLKGIAQTVLRQDASYYTLTFKPPNFQADNKWHKIHISLDKPGCTLSYRRGYFADANNLAPPPPPKPGSRNMLLTGGRITDAPPDIHSAPIIFTAGIVSSAQRVTHARDAAQCIALQTPSAPKHGTLAYFIRYTLAPGAFLVQTGDGNSRVTFDVSALAFSQNGVRIGQNGDRVRLTLAPDSSKLPICVEQQINLPKGDDYLFLAVWDVASGRLGSLQIPVTVK